ncbi:biotin/lipoate--protein ligase family protein [Stappia sp. 28M-7]|uniref:biotin/lipoate--protein ligase family protein n=1 Tax=Stappia sp. 28M-7 TaxID=2762596 RepID=UPI000FF17CE8|nr:biotin/lipoate--protein ligase family protein [Stappia sp. 28M-7]MBC2859274.1 hypothetical protein [Stappia sp. 28M-7]
MNELPEPVFPPLLKGHRLDGGAHPFEAAVAGAASRHYSAGDLLWSSDPAHVRIALVLEPDVEPARGIEMLFLAMVATTDAMGALIPPEVALTYEWPAVLRANGARVGRARFAQAQETGEDGAPLWLVVGIELRLAPVDGAMEPGEMPHLTSLVDEGAADLGHRLAVESLSRHMLTWIHSWDIDGFAPVLDNWLFRADGYKQEIVVPGPKGERRGTFLGIDEAGSLLLKPADGGSAVALALDEHLAHLDHRDSEDAALALHNKGMDQ